MAGLLADFPRRGPGHCGAGGKPGSERVTGKGRGIEACRLYSLFQDRGNGFGRKAIRGDVPVPVDTAKDRSSLDPGMGEPVSEMTDRAPSRAPMGYTKEQMTAHGFRTSASSLLNESGKWNPDAIERALAHMVSGEIRRIYNQSAYWAERVAMAQWWSDYLDELREGGNR